MKKKFLKLLSISILSMFCLSGCSTSTNLKSNNDELSKYELESYEKSFEELKDKNKLNSSDQVVIGLSLDSLKEPIWKMSRDSFVSKAEELGAEVRIEQANGDNSAQLSQIDKLIAEGVNVLVVVPHDGEVMGDAVEKAHNAGIKVVSFDRLIKNVDVDLYVAMDNVRVGEIQAESIISNVSSGNVAYIGGAETDNNALLFRSGALSKLEEHSDSINVVLDKYSPDWSSEEAYNNIASLLEENQDIQGIVCANDGTASGAIAALEKYNLAGKVYVTGLDAELAACKRIVEGTQFMTVYKPIKEFAGVTAELSIKLASGQNVQTNNTINNGKLDIPAYYIEPISVTKENMMDTVIKDGFHDFYDVYANVPENERPKKE